jgi:replication fork protection complex subunit Csm3/Swi3
MVEKMGHKRQMQMARLEWINEGKPKSYVHEDSLFDEPTVPSGENDGRGKTASRIAPVFEKATTERPKTPDLVADAEMDDLYDATPNATYRKAQKETQDLVPGGFSGGGSLFGPAKAPVVDSGPPEDDLDALLAEEEFMNAGTLKARPAINKVIPRQDSNFEEEMEAMAEMDMWE